MGKGTTSPIFRPWSAPSKPRSENSITRAVPNVLVPPLDRTDDQSRAEDISVSSALLRFQHVQRGDHVVPKSAFKAYLRPKQSDDVHTSYSTSSSLQGQLNEVYQQHYPLGEHPLSAFKPYCRTARPTILEYVPVDPPQELFYLEDFAAARHQMYIADRPTYIPTWPESIFDAGRVATSQLEEQQAVISYAEVRNGEQVAVETVKAGQVSDTPMSTDQWSPSATSCGEEDCYVSGMKVKAAMPSKSAGLEMSPQLSVDSPIRADDGSVKADQEATRKVKKTTNRPKNYKCEYCGHMFYNRVQVNGHIRGRHTGERPYKCNYGNCTKAFARNEELTRHSRIHTNDKPYPCPLCSKTFGRKDHLEKHKITHEKRAASAPVAPAFCHPGLTIAAAPTSLPAPPVGTGIHDWSVYSR